MTTAIETLPDDIETLKRLVLEKQAENCRVRTLDVQEGLHPGQAVGDQRADVAVVGAFWRGQYRAVVLAERQQRFFIAQAFEQGQAQGLARTFVLAGGVFHTAIVEGLWLVVIARRDKRQGVGK